MDSEDKNPFICQWEVKQPEKGSSSTINRKTVVPLYSFKFVSGSTDD